MILTCPQCETQFNLPQEALLPGGKRVRCSSCSHAWFQAPDDEVAYDIEQPEDPFDYDSVQEAVEDIPDSVKPERSEEIVIPEEAKKIPMAVIGGAGGALAVFVLLLAIVLGMHQSITKAFPAANAAYALFGYDPVIPGKGLVMDRLEMKKQDDGTYMISGHIINLTTHNQSVPKIRATLRDANQNTLETWMINPPKDDIFKEETMAFEAAYKPKSEEGADIKLQFALTDSHEMPPHTDPHDEAHKDAHQSDHKSEHHDDGAHH